MGTHLNIVVECTKNPSQYTHSLSWHSITSLSLSLSLHPIYPAYLIVWVVVIGGTPGNVDVAHQPSSGSHGGGRVRTATAAGTKANTPTPHVGRGRDGAGAGRGRRDESRGTRSRRDGTPTPTRQGGGGHGKAGTAAEGSVATAPGREEGVGRTGGAVARPGGGGGGNSL